MLETRKKFPPQTPSL